VVRAVLAVVGAAVSITEALRDRTPRWSPGIEELVNRGARRWRWWRSQPRVTDWMHRLTRWTHRFDQRLQADVDDVSDCGEELLAHAELIRWRMRRIPECALAAAVRRLRTALGRVCAPVTQSPACAHPSSPDTTGACQTRADAQR
jgi:hypothetical protein